MDPVRYADHGGAARGVSVQPEAAGLGPCRLGALGGPPVRVATWNLERPRRGDGARAERQRQAMERIDADIWVLTEAHHDLAPAAGFEGTWTRVADRDGAVGEVWTAIWSRYPLQPLPATRDEARAVGALVEPGHRRPVVVYGTVLPWLGSSWRGHPGAGGVAFAAALEAQLADWLHLRERYRDCDFILAGDFNQDLAIRHHYGSRRNQQVLRSALDTAGLQCLTSGDQDPVWRGTGGYRATVDHICANPELAARALHPASCWPAGRDPQASRSDHFGVVVQVG